MPLTLAERESLETSTAAEFKIAENLFVINSDWVENVLKSFYNSETTLDDIKLRVEHLPNVVVYFTDSLQKDRYRCERFFRKRCLDLFI